MSWITNIRRKLKEQLRVVASNPENFEEKWSFSSSRIQIYSLAILIFIIFGLLFNFLINLGPFSGYNSKNNSSIERKTLEKQHQEIEKLTSKIESQENYIKNISNVISGNISQDSLSSLLPDAQKLIQPKLNAKATDSEKKLAEKVKDDMRSNDSGNENDKKNITYFSTPVSGFVLTKFDLLTHPAIDIVTSKDMTIKACLAGTIIYSGFTQKEGFLMIIEHVNGYISIYKNAKITLKKIGAKVQIGDPIAIVGDTGEKINKPHLHFELWYNQSPVNPLNYMNF
jgi:hypothetical protein